MAGGALRLDNVEIAGSDPATVRSYCSHVHATWLLKDTWPRPGRSVWSCTGRKRDLPLQVAALFISGGAIDLVNSRVATAVRCPCAVA